MRSCGFKSHLPHHFKKYFRMRKCRNWQTSKTKDLVINAIVWVQVPSSAPDNDNPNPVPIGDGFGFLVYLEC